MGRNLLEFETSPYLLQHKDNPVWWRPWGPEAFSAAKAENKPIFLSIGYSTCYWCHVMERDSFEQPDVAELLNQWFITIKVDREERPDIDQIYMDAVVALTGHGGWPMSVFLTPDLRPFWGATFFYREQFKRVLTQIHEVWENDRERVLRTASSLSEALSVAAPAGPVDSPAVVGAASHALESSFDPEWGGFGSAPKFPPAEQLRFLLRESLRRRDPELQGIVTTTLGHMASGGIFDQIDGGFSRYSTDDRWLVPHFEKMLYDNALLVRVYCEAYQSTREEWCGEVARETVNYLLSRLRSPEGGFYSAEDAGDVGREGEFYVWEHKELKRILSSEELGFAQEHLGVSPHGNFEGKNVLHLRSGWESRQTEQFVSIRKKLAEAREQRVRPHRDEKILTGWNGLTISALSLAAATLDDETFYQAARQCAEFVLERLASGPDLRRSYSRGAVRHDGCLEDYAYFIEGLLNLYAYDFELRWVELARQFQRRQDELFLADDGGYYATHAREVYVRKKDLLDNATPSGNSVSAGNLRRLFALYGEPELHQRREGVVRAASSLLERYPSAIPRLVAELSDDLIGARQLVISAVDGAESVDRLLRSVRHGFTPGLLVARAGENGHDEAALPALLRGKHADGAPRFYLCDEGACRAPVESDEEVLSQLRERGFRPG